MMLLREKIPICELQHDALPVPKDQNDNDINTLVSILRDDMDFDDLTHIEADVIYSVCGYVSKFVQCVCVPPSISENLIVDRTHFDSMSRGGWKEPSTNVLFICTAATSAFKVLIRHPHKQTFLAMSNHRAIFVASVSRLLFESLPILTECSHVKRILMIYFNILAKNFTREVNDLIVSNTCFRKIQKLTSRSSTN